MILFTFVFSSARAVVTKCIDDNEVGKVLSGFAIMAALIPFGSNPSKTSRNQLFSNL